MFLRNFALALLVLTFLVAAHEATSGAIAMIFAVVLTAVVVGHVVGCIAEFVRDKNTSGQIGNYAWLAFPLAIQIYYLGMNYSTAVAVLWMAGMATLLLLKTMFIGKAGGNTDKLIDGLLGSGMPLG